MKSNLNRENSGANGTNRPANRSESIDTSPDGVLKGSRCLLSIDKRPSNGCHESEGSSFRLGVGVDSFSPFWLFFSQKKRSGFEGHFGFLGKMKVYLFD